FTTKDAMEHKGPLRTFVLFLLLLFFFAPGLSAADRTELFYYVPYDDSWQSLQAHATRIGLLAPQVLMLDAAGTGHGEVEDRVGQLEAEHRIPPMPLLANEKPEYAHTLLADPELRARAIADALAACREVQCLGLQIDLEGIAPADGELFTSF